MSLNAEQLQAALAELSSAQDCWRYAASKMAAADLHYGHGTDNAWDEAGALVMQALGIAHEHIEHVAPCRLTAEERKKIAHWLDKRINARLPLPYISGKSWFCGLEFQVDARVLIPRSPMAELIQRGFSPWLGERRINRVLDLCCGSACIAIACQYAFPEAEIVAADISSDALMVAVDNCQRHGLAERLQLVESDGLSALTGQRFDLIVCNPPYVDAGDMASLPTEYKHEPALALASGDDGLTFVRRLLSEAAAHLTPGGLLFCEVGNSYLHVQEQFPQVPFTWIEFERSEDGVFLISREQLLQYF